MSPIQVSRLLIIAFLAVLAMGFIAHLLGDKTVFSEMGGWIAIVGVIAIGYFVWVIKFCENPDKIME